jgi:hypothetical protein
MVISMFVRSKIGWDGFAGPGRLQVVERQQALACDRGARNQ